MKKQKVLSLILAAALCVSTPASAMAAEFSSGSENDAVQVTTEVATEDSFTDSTDTTEETTENAEVTEFAPEVEDGEEDATLNAEAGSDIDDATSISLNTKYTGALSDNNDADFYKVTLNEAGAFSIRGIFRTPHIRWRLYDDLGTKLDGRDWRIDGLTQRGACEYSWNLTRGTYYISIDRYRDGGTGTYSFTLGLKSANETIPEEQGGSNNTSDDADEILLNKTYRGQIAFNDLVDWYKFNVPKTETVKVMARTQNSTAYWAIYQEVDGIMTEIHAVSGPSSLDFDENLDAGNYYLAVQASYSHEETTYQFKFQTHTHSWKNEITKATLTENGTIIPRCACGETGTIKTIYCPKTIRLSKTKYKYNGYAQKPTVKVIGSDGKVISPSYYKVTYSRGLTAKGKYTVKITFKGRYSGSVKKYFKIV